MLPEDSPAWLPAGWAVQDEVKRNGRKVRYYINLETGKKYSSEKAVIRYGNLGNIHCSNPNALRTPTSSPSGNKFTSFIEESDGPPGWLPEGWTVELKVRKSGLHIGEEYETYIEPVTGLKFHSKIEVFQYLKSGKGRSPTPEQIKEHSITHSPDINPSNGIEFHNEAERLEHLEGEPVNCQSKQKKSRTREHSGRKVVFQKFEADGLPPGWIKEIKITQNQNKIRKDPFYTDPVSGCIFRSKLDALRYIETGEMGRHVIKPKEMLINDQKSLPDELLSPSAAKRQKSANATGRHLITGLRTSDMGIITPLLVSGSREKQGKTASTEPLPVSTPTQGHLQEQLLNTMSKNCADIEEISGSSRDAVPISVIRKENDFSEGPVSIPADGSLEEKKMLNNGKEKDNEETVKERNKFQKKLNAHCRYSKRIAGLEPEPVADLSSGERALRLKVRSPKDGATLAPTLADREPQQPEIEAGAMPMNDTSEGKEAPIEETTLDERKKPHEGLFKSEEEPRKLEMENDVSDEKTDVQLAFPFAEPWLDPCLEFAFKTLTGALPLDDDLTIQSYFQQLEASNTQNNGDLGLADFGVPGPSFCGSEQNLLEQPPVQPSVDVNFPSCSGADDPKPDLGGNKI